MLHCMAGMSLIVTCNTGSWSKSLLYCSVFCALFALLHPEDLLMEMLTTGMVINRHSKFLSPQQSTFHHGVSMRSAEHIRCSLEVNLIKFSKSAVTLHGLGTKCRMSWLVGYPQTLICRILSVMQCKSWLECADKGVGEMARESITWR